MFSDWLNYPYKDQWQETVNGQTVFVQPEVVNPRLSLLKDRPSTRNLWIMLIYSLIPYPKHIAVKYEGDVKAFTRRRNLITYLIPAIWAPINTTIG